MSLVYVVILLGSPQLHFYLTLFDHKFDMGMAQVAV
jgi:hypothetical protein